MKTFHLVLKKKWFDMILSGEKKEEYREIKEHWIKQLVEPTDEEVTVEAVIHYLRGGELTPWHNHNFRIKQFDVVVFRNGYQRNAPTITVKCKGINATGGRTNWGAVEGERYFVIRLGEILSSSNITQ
jgi:hypothetical protein